MPIVRWTCRGCGGREVSLAHFRESACGETVCHPDYAAAILGDRAAQSVGAVRVTHGLGCPRRAAIEQVEDYAADPLDFNAAMTGIAWHAAMDGAEGTEVEVGGEIAGVKVVGRVDRLRGDLIEDWKHKSDFGLKYIKEGAEPEHTVQLSIYAELARQCVAAGCLDHAPTRAIIWYHGSTNGALHPRATSLLPIDAALAHKPYGGDWTVAELYAQADSIMSGRVHWSALPLSGASMKFGSKSMCQYCSVQPICSTAENGAPF